MNIYAEYMETTEHPRRGYRVYVPGWPAFFYVRGSGRNWCWEQRTQVGVYIAGSFAEYETRAEAVSALFRRYQVTLEAS